MDVVFGWISQYGYAAIFGLLVFGIVGLPVPDETLLVFTGYLISRGRLHLIGAAAAAFSGSGCGISLSYVIGRTLGLGFVNRYGKYVHLTRERIEIIERWYHKHGNWLLTVGYYIPGVRHFTAFVAGMSCLDYKIFAVFAYVGAAIWVASFLALGYVVGENWKVLADLVERYSIALTVIAICAGLLIWWLRARRAHRGR